MNFGTSVLRTQYNSYIANIQAQILVANQNYVVFLSKIMFDSRTSLRP